MSNNIVRFNTPTSGGNTLQFFYNPENNLVVVDIVHKNGSGGNELHRQTLDEGVLLKHCRKTRKKDHRKKLLEQAIKASDENDTSFRSERFPYSDWQYDVGNGDTKLGYIDWVIHNLESADFDEEVA